MIKEYTVDPRVKIAISVCITTMAIIFNDVLYNGILLLISLFLALTFRANIKDSFKKLKSFIVFCIILSLIQSIFNHNGIIYFYFFNIPILTSGGLVAGVAFLFRMLVLIISGIIISTSSRRDVIQGLIQMKIPYELAFMTNVAILFIPTLRDEINSSIIAIELRGVDIKELKVKDRMNLYGNLVLPVIVRSINKARTISMAMDVRAFRLYPTRSSLKTLKLNILDYIIIFITVLASIMFVIKYLGVI